MDFYASDLVSEKPMQRLAQMMDDLDDVLGVFSAASSYSYILIVALSIALVIVAGLAFGAVGLLVSLLVSGAAIGAATSQTRHH